MFPTDFEQSNFTFKKPAGMTDDQCGDLKVYRGVDGEDVPVIISCWKPTPEEVEAINKGEGVWLYIIGVGMPPVFLTCENPFAQTT